MEATMHYCSRACQVVALVTMLFLQTNGCAVSQHSPQKGPERAPSESDSLDPLEQSRIMQDPLRRKSMAAYYFGLGCLYWDEQDIERTLDNFKKALVYDPDSAYINYTLATLFRQLGAYESDRTLRIGALQRAEYYLENAFVSDPDDPDIVAGLADVSSRLGKTGASIDLWRKLLSLKPDALEARYSLARELSAIKEYRESNEIVHDLLQKDQESPRAFYLLGFNYYNLKQDDLALKYLELAYEANSYDSSLVLNLGNLYEKQRDYAKAAEIYKKISLVSPKDSPFYKRYVRALFLLQRFDETETVINEVLAAGDEEFIWYFFLGLIAEEREDFPVALKHFTKARELDASDSRVVYEMFYILYRMGETDRGVNVLEEARDKEPDRLAYYGYLGDAWMMLERYDKAIASYQQGLERSPENTDLLFQLAVVFERVDRFEGAEQCLQKVIEINSQHSEALNFLGYLYAERGEKLTLAEEYLHQALKAEPENGAYLDSLGWILFKKDQYGKALETLLHASRLLQHNDPVVLDHVAQTSIEIRCYTLAVTAWERAMRLDPGNTTYQEKINHYQDAAGKDEDSCNQQTISELLKRDQVSTEQESHAE